MPPIDSRFSIDEFGYTGNSELTEETFKKGKELQFIGHYAIDNYGDKSGLRIKECSEYYESGELKSRGEYQIGKYIQCCSAGPCEQYYNYRIGDWEYYYENGKLMASCTYMTRELHIDTSCKGGDSLKFNEIESLKYYNEAGLEIEPTQELRNQLVTVQAERYSYTIDPRNSRQVIIAID